MILVLSLNLYFYIHGQRSLIMAQKTYDGALPRDLCYEGAYLLEKACTFKEPQIWSVYNHTPAPMDLL